MSREGFVILLEGKKISEITLQGNGLYRGDKRVIATITHPPSMYVVDFKEAQGELEEPSPREIIKSALTQFVQKHDISGANGYVLWDLDRMERSDGNTRINDFVRCTKQYCVFLQFCNWKFARR